MNIAGGTYGERCMYPRWDQMYGSGLRAAIALADVSPGSTLHSYVPRVWQADFAATLASLGLNGVPHLTNVPITFEYLHTFERLEAGEEINLESSMTLEGEAILRFGMMEGDAKVAGERVVYDPQSPNPVPFDANGSRAANLALVVFAEPGAVSDNERYAYYPPVSLQYWAIDEAAGQAHSQSALQWLKESGSLNSTERDEATD